MSHRYMLLTVDTEALPARASERHVEKLVWGEYENGRAGISEFVDLSKEHNLVFTFFVEVARSLWEPEKHREYWTWLIRNNQDVQLHFHPEIFQTKDLIHLPLNQRPGRQDKWNAEEAFQMISWAAQRFFRFTGTWPTAYRAGSFRWNKETIRALRKLDIKLSFNNCYEAVIRSDNLSPSKLINDGLFQWDKKVVEVPCTEVLIGEELAHLSFPRRLPVKDGLRGLCKFLIRKNGRNQIFNLLLHSWSFLNRDRNSGYFYYQDDRRIENFNKFLKWAKREFEVISATELSQLVQDGRVRVG